MQTRAQRASIEQAENGTVTVWDEEAERLFGWPSAEIVGLPFHRLVPDRNRGRYDAWFRTCVESPGGGAQTREITARHRDGHEFRVEISCSGDTHERAGGIAVTAREMTPEMRAGEAVQAFRRSDRYRAILDQIEDGCFVVDLRGNYLFVNDAFCRMFGFSRDTILGGSFKQFYNPARVRETHDIFGRVFRTGQPAKYEHAVLGDGRTVDFVEQSISLERDEDGRPTGFLGIARDCTARKRVEAELARAKESAEAANRAKSEFLANMSHEIRTPMNGIIGMTALALETPLTPYQTECLSTISDQSNSLLTIINDILDFSKIESRKLPLESIAFAIGDAIRETAAPLAVRARQKGIAFFTEMAADTPARLAGDPIRLRQILTNLLANAVKFTDRGSVGLEVSVDARTADEVTLHFRVADTGIGIPADQHAAIFDAFRQADGSMTRRFGGTGLGLAIASTLVGLMGGRLWVQSAPGAGSTFHFTATFPIVPDLALSAAPRPRPVEAPTRRARVLIAEDNVVNQRVAAGLLTRRGHDVTIVTNGREAFAAIQRDLFDVVLMDVQMPDMNGFEATAAIRAYERATGQHLRIVAMTAHAMLGDRERCVEAGMDGYISKPFEPRALYEFVEKDG
ncbi:MAG: PAS domain S-box protein [Vicinamibacterales bacterium]